MNDSNAITGLSKLFYASSGFLCHRLEITIDESSQL